MGAHFDHIVRFFRDIIVGIHYTPLKGSKITCKNKVISNFPVIYMLITNLNNITRKPVESYLVVNDDVMFSHDRLLMYVHMFDKYYFCQKLFVMAFDF